MFCTELKLNTQPKKVCEDFAIKCAYLVLPLYETKYPEDKRLQYTLEVVKIGIKNPSNKNIRAIKYAQSEILAIRIEAGKIDADKKDEKLYGCRYDNIEPILMVFCDLCSLYESADLYAESIARHTQEVIFLTLAASELKIAKEKEADDDAPYTGSARKIVQEQHDILQQRATQQVNIILKEVIDACQKEASEVAARSAAASPLSGRSAAYINGYAIGKARADEAAKKDSTSNICLLGRFIRWLAGCPAEPKKARDEYQRSI